MKTHPVSCIILAGGEGKRVGHADKGLIQFNGQSLIAHVITALQNQVDDIVISANRNLEQYKQFSPIVIPDVSGNHGPLSGIAAALPACIHELVLVVPCDMPYLPDNLLTRLLANVEQHDIAIVEIKDRLQLVFLMRKSLLNSAQNHVSSKKYKLMQWVLSCSHTIVNFNETADSFKNMNSIDQLNQS
ncbi:MAG: molybdenum cofactor guanylyltransferase [Gammaproteobacteria bacterium]|nr:molybdenum cofactor guanylyltransferase [Gammaproteobacteria bacterium]